MIDGGLRSLFKTKLREFHWQAIETGGTGLGIPDSNFCHQGIEGWVEYKVAKGWAVTLRPEQVGWHLKRSANGGRTFIAVRQTIPAGPRRGEAVDRLWLAHGGRAKELFEAGLRKEWLEASPPWIQVHDSGIADWDWQSVRAFLLAS